MKQPCSKECENRSPTCHGSCAAYLEYFEHRRAVNAWNQEDATTGYLKEVRKKRKDRYHKSFQNNK